MSLAEERLVDRTLGTQPCDLVVVVPHLGPGGSQKVAASLANRWTARGYRVAVVSLWDSPMDTHALSEQVIRLRLSQVSDELAETVAMQVREKEIRERVAAMPKPVRLFVIAALSGGLRLASANSAVSRYRRYLEAIRWLGRLLVPAKLRWHVRRLAFPARQNGRRLFQRGRAVARKVAKGLLSRFVRHNVMLASPSVLDRVSRLRILLMHVPSRSVLSFLGTTNIQTLLACEGMRRRVVISERNDPAIQALEEPWESLRASHYSRADVVTANSRGAAGTLSSMVRDKQVIYVPNPISLPNLDSDSSPVYREFVWCGRMVPQKGLGDLIKAFEEAAFRLPDPWHLRLVGGGSEEESLKRLASRSRARNWIIFQGRVSDVGAFLRPGAIFVLPSLHEGTPNALLEAMAHGLPSIVSDSSPGPLELIEEGRTGLVVPARSPERLSAAMIGLATQPELASRLGAAARARVEDLTWPRIEPIWARVLDLDPVPGGDTDTASLRTTGS